MHHRWSFWQHVINSFFLQGIKKSPQEKHKVLWNCFWFCSVNDWKLFQYLVVSCVHCSMIKGTTYLLPTTYYYLLSRQFVDIQVRNSTTYLKKKQTLRSFRGTTPFYLIFIDYHTKKCKFVTWKQLINVDCEMKNIHAR